MALLMREVPQQILEKAYGAGKQGTGTQTFCLPNENAVTAAVMAKKLGFPLDALDGGVPPSMGSLGVDRVAPAAAINKDIDPFAAVEEEIRSTNRRATVAALIMSAVVIAGFYPVFRLISALQNTTTTAPDGRATTDAGSVTYTTVDAGPAFPDAGPADAGNEGGSPSPLPKDAGTVRPKRK